jgi:hypothetical protein
MAQDDFRYESTSYEVKDVECPCGWVGAQVSVENNMFLCVRCKKRTSVYVAAYLQFREQQVNQISSFLTEEGLASFRRLQTRLAVDLHVSESAVSIFVGTEGVPVDSYLDLWLHFVKTSNLLGLTVRRGVGSGTIIKQRGSTLGPAVATRVEQPQGATRFNLLELA